MCAEFCLIGKIYVQNSVREKKSLLEVLPTL